jgi:CDP-diacylglycerol---glycerol-3-phosphate 3-phosphatidyltransferase
MTTEPRPPLEPAESTVSPGLPAALPPRVEPAMAAPLQSVPQVVSGARSGPSAEPALLNVANLLTMLRLALVPVFIAFLLAHDGHGTGWRLAATGVFAVAALTDRFDGEIARRRGLVTKFGTIADPIADKALIGAALIGLSALGDLSWWVTVVIAVRELGVTGLRFWVLRHGVIAASRGGKLKTLVQSLAIGLYVLPLTAVAPVPVVDQVRWWLMGLAVALTLVTGGDYVLRALRLRARGTAAARAVTGAG